jgi:hypothetical protein
VAGVAKCQGPRAGGGPLPLPASELKNIKIYLPANFNYLKYLFMCFHYLMEILKVFCS